MTGGEVRILDLERKALRLYERITRLEARTTAGEQSATMCWVMGEDSTCTVTVSGTVSSGCGGDVPGAVVTFSGYPSGFPAGSITSDGSGNLAGTLTVLVTDTGLTWAAASPTPGLAGATGTIGSVSCGGTVVCDPVLALNSGYVCWMSCGIPIATSYNPTVTDPFGATTLTWDSGHNWWSAATNPAYSGCGGCAPACAAVAKIYVAYALKPDGTLGIFCNLSGGCPISDSSSALPPSHGTNFGFAAPTSASCPPSFGASYTAPSASRSLYSVPTGALPTITVS